MPGALDSLLGTPETMQQFPLYGQQQQSAIMQILQQALSGLKNPTQGFEPFAQQAQRNFATQTVPSLAERFTQMGGQGRQETSSAFSGALGSASSDLNAQLAALKMQYGLGQQQHYGNLLNSGLTPLYGQKQVPGQQGWLDTILGGLGAAAGAFGGPALSAAGAELGRRFGQWGQNAYQNSQTPKLSVQQLADNNSLQNAQGANMYKTQMNRLGGGY